MGQWKRLFSGNSSGDDDDDGYNLTLIISTIRQTRQASFHRIGQLFPNQTIMNLTNHLALNLVILEHFGKTVACVRKYAQLCSVPTFFLSRVSFEMMMVTMMMIEMMTMGKMAMMMMMMAIVKTTMIMTMMMTMMMMEDQTTGRPSGSSGYF